jgi:DNA-directed RNA polymerase delta subunit
MKKGQILEIGYQKQHFSNLFLLIIPFARELITGLGYKNDFAILSRRYGFEDNKTYTLEEIGSFLGITRERTRQLEQRSIHTLQAVLNGQNTRVKCPLELVQEFQQLNTELSQIGKIITENEVKVDIHARYHYEVTEKDLPTVRLILTLFNFKKLRDVNPHSDKAFSSSWMTNKNIHEQDIFEIQTKIQKVLLDTPKPLSFFDLVININKGRKKPFSQELVSLCLKTLEIVGKNDNECYQINFEYLKSLADKAYRVLFENNVPMKVIEIHKELSYRLSHSHLDPHIPIRSVSQQLVDDTRFKTIGKAGWALSEWESISTSSAVQIIREYFFARKTEATVGEIVEYVQKKRPDIHKQSIYAYLAQKDKFTKVSKETYVPKEWKWKELESTLSPRASKTNTIRDEIQKSVIIFLASQENDWTKLSKLKAYVIKSVKCNGQTFYQYLSEMIQIDKETRPDGVYCRLLPFANSANTVEANEDWAKIISAGETKTVEFKRAAKWNDYEKKPDGNMIQQIVIEVAGFMNSDISGRIFIGIDDKTNSILGIEDDIKVTDKGKPNRDGYSLFLSNSILSKLGKDLGQLFETHFQVVDGKDVCCIEVLSAPRIVYYEGQLYLRGNTQTNLLNAAEAVEFAKRKGIR